MKRALLALTLMLFCHQTGNAQTPYYQGKTITITVGYQPGDGYDIWARVRRLIWGNTFRAIPI